MLQYCIEKYQYRSILVNIVSISYRSKNPGIAHHYYMPSRGKRALIFPHKRSGLITWCFHRQQLGQHGAVAKHTQHNRTVLGKCRRLPCTM